MEKVTNKEIEVKLDKVFETKEFFKNEHFLNIFLSCVGSDYQMPVPTEFVSATARGCTPYMARAYSTDLIFFHGRVRPYEDWRLAYKKCKKHNPKIDLASPPNVYLWEIWEDWGEDGHTHFKHVGYSFSLRALSSSRVYPVKWVKGLDRG